MIFFDWYQVVAGIVYVAWSTIMLKLKIDDPIDAISIHLGCGIWSVLSVGYANRNALITAPNNRLCKRLQLTLFLL